MLVGGLGFLEQRLHELEQLARAGVRLRLGRADDGALDLVRKRVEELRSRLLRADDDDLRRVQRGGRRGRAPRRRPSGARRRASRGAAGAATAKCHPGRGVPADPPCGRRSPRAVPARRRKTCPRSRPMNATIAPSSRPTSCASGARWKLAADAARRPARSRRPAAAGRSRRTRRRRTRVHLRRLNSLSKNSRIRAKSRFSPSRSPCVSSSWRASTRFSASERSELTRVSTAVGVGLSAGIEVEVEADRTASLRPEAGELTQGCPGQRFGHRRAVCPGCAIVVAPLVEHPSGRYR